MTNDLLLQDVYNAFHTIPGVSDVLSLHIWTVAKERSGLTAHMSVENRLIGELIAVEARKIAVEQGIRYTNFQIDTQPCRTIWQTMRGSRIDFS